MSRVPRVGATVANTRYCVRLCQTHTCGNNWYISVCAHHHHHHTIMYTRMMHSTLQHQAAFAQFHVLIPCACVATHHASATRTSAFMHDIMVCSMECGVGKWYSILYFVLYVATRKAKLVVCTMPTSQSIITHLFSTQRNKAAVRDFSLKTCFIYMMVLMLFQYDLGVKQKRRVRYFDKRQMASWDWATAMRPLSTR